MSGSMDWRGALAPDLAAFEAIVQEAFQALPHAFRVAVEDSGVAIRVEDFPTEEVCREMECESPYDLLGLYQGVDLTRKSHMDPGGAPDMVFLYRRPILDLWADGEERLGAIITHVLVHEIGHHFGLSDEDMEALEAEAG